jgi:hypothetical protein
MTLVHDTTKFLIAKNYSEMKKEFEKWLKKKKDSKFEKKWKRKMKIEKI